MSIRKNLEHRGNKSVRDKIPKSASEHSGTLVRIVDFDQSKHLVKVVKEVDNKPLLKDQTVDKAIEQKKRYEPTVEKVLKTSEANDGPIISANDNYVSMRGNDDFGFFSYREGGANIIKGPLSIATEPHQVRLAGLTTLNPLITSGFASTIVTPLPTTVWSLPTAAMIKPLLKDILIMGTILAAAGSAG